MCTAGKHRIWTIIIWGLTAMTIDLYWKQAKYLLWPALLVLHGFSLEAPFDVVGAGTETSTQRNRKYFTFSMMLVLQWLNEYNQKDFERRVYRGFCQDLNSQSLMWESGVLPIRPQSYLRNRATFKFISPSLYFTKQLICFSNLYRFWFLMPHRTLQYRYHIMHVARYRCNTKAAYWTTLSHKNSNNKHIPMHTKKETQSC